MRSNEPKLSELAERLLPAPLSVHDAPGRSRYGGRLPTPALLHATRVGDALPVPIDTVPPATPLPPEGFQLTIGTRRITLAAGDARGRRYGVAALAGLLEAAEACGPRTDRAGGGRHPTLPTGEIHDRPAITDRGYLLDVSRNRIPKRATLIELLDQLAALRYNHLELYFEHVFAYRGHETVWRESGAVSAADVLWLDRECSARGIELVPNQNSFGHMAGWLRHADYRDLAIAPDGFVDPWGRRRNSAFSLDPRSARTRGFLADLYDQLLPLFTSKRFNVGMDETFDLGQGRSAAAIDAIQATLLAADPTIDATDARHRAIGALYREMVQTVHELVAERGHRAYLWADIVQNHPELIPELPREITAIEWGYEADHPFDQRCARLAEAGVAFLAAPGTASWNSPSGRLHTAERNIAAAVRAVIAHGGAGMLLTDWGDNDHLPPIAVSLPPIVYAGALAWNPAGALDRDRVFAYLDTLAAFDAPSPDTAALRALTTLEDHDDAPVVHNGSLLGAALSTFDVPRYARYLEPGYLRRDAAKLLTTIEQRLATLDTLQVADPAAGRRASIWRDGLAPAGALARYAQALLRARAANTTASSVQHAKTAAESLVTLEWQVYYQPNGLAAARRRLQAAADAALFGREHDA